MGSKIQSETRKILSKVFPLRELQIKSILLLGDADEKKMKKVSVVEEEVKEEEPGIIEGGEAKETVEEESEAEENSEDEAEEETEEQ